MFDISVHGRDLVISTLTQISSPIVRMRLLTVAAKQVIASAQARVDNQTDLLNRAFAPHARGRTRKMLARLVQRIVDRYTDDSATVGWRNPYEATIAARQQYGYRQKFHKSQFRNRRSGNRSDPATRRQAIALLEAGYKTRTAKTPYKTPTVQWIMEHLNIGQAGLILRILRGSKTEWTTTLPPRSFLGITQDDLAELQVLLTAELARAIEAT